MENNEFKKNYNSPHFYFTVILSIVLYGFLVTYSASYYESFIHNLPHDYFFKRQVIFAIIALFFSLMLHFINFKIIKFFTYPLVILSIVLMLLTLFTPFGVTILGARRWLSIGPIPSIQPSEIVKVSTILFISKYYTEEKHNDIIALVVVLLFAGLILLQRDYSTTIVYLITSFSLLLVCGCDFKAVFLLILFLIVPAILFLFSESYRIKRVVSFIFPTIDPNGLNYQINKSIDAISSGGFFGKGIGNGYYKLGILPEVQNDFIFANIGEELGIIGIFVIILLFYLIAHIGYKTSKFNYPNNKYYSYVSFGITTTIVIQAIINMMVVTALLPPTGIPLPFFSQGGTNLFFSIVLTAIVHKIICESNASIELKEREDLSQFDILSDYEEDNFD